MLKRFFIILLLSAVSYNMWGQYDAKFSHYWAMEPSFNPAAVGKESKVNITAAYAMALTGFENNPKTMYAAADMPLYALNSYHGLGVEFLNDQIGLFTNKKFAAKYAYKHRLFNGMLSIGLQVSMLSESFDGSKLDLEETGDHAFVSSQMSGSGFDMSAGLYYTHQNWYAGFSVQHALSPVIDMDEQLPINRIYYFTGGYNIKLRNPFLTIHSSVLARTDEVGYRVDVTGLLRYTNENKMFYGGVAYSPSNSVTLLIGGIFHGVSLGYSYEAYTSSIGLSNGSHELFVGYQTNLNLYKKGRNKHKSVRLL